MTCCFCESSKDVKWCPLCHHNFCVRHRNDLFWRGLEAVKDWIGCHSPRHCDHGGD